jgi:hypothetical protein
MNPPYLFQTTVTSLRNCFLIQGTLGETNSEEQRDRCRSSRCCDRERHCCCTATRAGNKFQNRAPCSQISVDGSQSTGNHNETHNTVEVNSVIIYDADWAPDTMLLSTEQGPTHVTGQHVSVLSGVGNHITAFRALNTVAEFVIHKSA